MFSTVIGEMYGRDHAGHVARALTDICSPFDAYGWSSAGVYMFWDPRERRPLYIGYSTNLARRFCEHNGLVPCDSNSCIANELDEYLDAAQPPLVGFSILVQEPFIKIKGTRGDPELADPTTPYEVDLDDIRAIEARLIEVWERAFGTKPRWNAARGSVAGRKKVTPDDLHVLEIMAFRQKSFIVSRSMLREISNKPNLYEYEDHLHAERSRLINLGLDEGHYKLSDELKSYALGPQPFLD